MTATSTTPPSGVYLTALSMRLPKRMRRSRRITDERCEFRRGHAEVDRPALGERDMIGDGGQENAPQVHRMRSCASTAAS